MTSVSDEVARVQAPVALIENSLTAFAKALPRHIPAERFGQWAIATVSRALRDPKTAEAWTRVLASEAGRLSVMDALMESARLGLEPGREYHLVPFGQVVSGITDYKGEIRLITNAQRCTVIAQLVHKNDILHMLGANIPPHHEADWFDDENRGEVIGGYCYTDMGSQLYTVVTRMSRMEIEKHRAKSKASRPDSPWVEWWDSMALKTLVHQQRKFVPWSPERLWT